MCGIAGILELDDAKEIDRASLKAMTQTLAHRGPDDEGYWIEGCVGMGHRRLSVIDLEKGKQPLSNEDDTVWVTYNGEIYNYHELRSELKAKGHTFKTSSDTEVIVHAYEEEGENAFCRFRGMFAFALWDKSKQALYLVRDPLGIKPLYYYQNTQRLLFASELKAFYANPDCSLDIDIFGLDRYLTYGFIVSPYTIYKGCRKVKPGTYVCVEGGQVHMKRYWDFPLQSDLSQNLSFQEASTQVLERLRESVSSHLVSDVPIGAFLSGGIDSSSVVCLMSQSISEKVPTFSIGFDDPQYDESAAAEKIAQFFGTQHHSEKVLMQPQHVLQEIISIFDEPFSDSSAIPTYFLSKMARQKVKVALSGDGGDENFAGYRRYWIDLALCRIRRYLPLPLRKLVYLMGRCFPSITGSGFIKRIGTALRQIGLDEPQGYFHSISLMKPEEKRQMYHSEYFDKVNENSPYDEFRELYERYHHRDPLTRMIYTDIHTFLPDDYLTKVDRTSMAHGLEVRVPMLDLNLLSFTFFLDSSYKVQGSQSKLLFRRALKEQLPEDILAGSKKGFEMPLEVWLRGGLKTLVESKVLKVDSFTAKFIKIQELKRRWDKFLAGKYRNAHLFWALLVLELWQDSQVKNR